MLASSSLHIPGWPWGSDPLAFSPWVLGFQACTTISSCWGLNSELRHARQTFYQASCIPVLKSALGEGMETWDSGAVNCREDKVRGRRTSFWPGMRCCGRTSNIKALVSTPCTLGYTWLQQGVGVMASTCSMMTSGSWPLAQEFWAEPNTVKRSETAHCCSLQGEPEGSLQGTRARPWSCL